MKYLWEILTLFLEKYLILKKIRFVFLLIFSIAHFLIFFVWQSSKLDEISTQSSRKKELLQKSKRSELRAVTSKHLKSTVNIYDDPKNNTEESEIAELFDDRKDYLAFEAHFRRFHSKVLNSTEKWLEILYLFIPFWSFFHPTSNLYYNFIKWNKKNCFKNNVSKLEMFLAFDPRWRDLCFVMIYFVFSMGPFIDSVCLDTLSQSLCRLSLAVPFSCSFSFSRVECCFLFSWFVFFFGIFTSKFSSP